MNRRFRWAPTPSGPLHLGNLLSMILTWLRARESGAELLLRIDDLDFGRARSEYVDGIFSNLHSLGLDWDLGPRDRKDFEDHFSQRLAQDDYQIAFEEALSKAPDLFFVCDCSRRDQNTSSIGSCRCRERNLRFLNNGTQTWRLRSDLLNFGFETIEDVSLGDCVIFRKEKFFAYQWVSLIEDLRWSISDVIRGEDLLASTRLQSGLARALAQRGLQDYSRFLNIHFVHHPLLFDGDKKLSKSDGAKAVNELCKTPRRLFEVFARWMNFDRKDFESSRELLGYYLDQVKGGRRFEVSKVWQVDELLG